jgi:hypothetical protein
MRVFGSSDFIGSSSHKQKISEKRDFDVAT